MEKFDGIRAMFEPSFASSCGFRTRGAGKLWQCTDPDLLQPLVAANLRLDGELWVGRGKWEETGKFMEGKWESITFKVFDAPTLPGGFLERLEAARGIISALHTERVQVVQAVPVLGQPSTVEELLTRVLSVNGEGLILRDINSRFKTGRQRTIIKVKKFYSGDCMVVGKVPGKDSVIVLTKEYGSRFDVTWHGGDKLGPLPPNGTVVTYEYPGLNHCGMPRFAGKILKVHRRTGETSAHGWVAPCACESCQLAKSGNWPDDLLPSKSGMGGPR